MIGHFAQGAGRWLAVLEMGGLIAAKSQMNLGTGRTFFILTWNQSSSAGQRLEGLRRRILGWCVETLVLYVF